MQTRGDYLILKGLRTVNRRRTAGKVWKLTGDCEYFSKTDGDIPGLQICLPSDTFD